MAFPIYERLNVDLLGDTGPCEGLALAAPSDSSLCLPSGWQRTAHSSPGRVRALGVVELPDAHRRPPFNCFNTRLPPPPPTFTSTSRTASCPSRNHHFYLSRLALERGRLIVETYTGRGTALCSPPFRRSLTALLIGLMAWPSSASICTHGQEVVCRGSRGCNSERQPQHSHRTFINTKNRIDGGSCVCLADIGLGSLLTIWAIADEVRWISCKASLLCRLRLPRTVMIIPLFCSFSLQY